jgi:hypothetical protein
MYRYLLSILFFLKKMVTSSVFLGGTRPTVPVPGTHKWKNLSRHVITVTYNGTIYGTWTGNVLPSVPKPGSGAFLHQGSGMIFSGSRILDPYHVPKFNL